MGLRLLLVHRSLILQRQVEVVLRLFWRTVQVRMFRSLRSCLYYAERIGDGRLLILT